MGKEPKYPIGEQSFPALREEGFLYVDKTRYIEKIIEGSKYYFLGRPRRFGKSLFLSTLKSFFEGRRDLFKGLYADTIDWDWEPYPVLHIALNMWDYTKHGMLEAAFNEHLVRWEEEYGQDYIAGDISSRFRNVIRRAYEVTGKRVVVLVDEYDNPLVDTLDIPEMFESYRTQLSSIYSNFKSSADYLRLVFLTGVSRFGKISVFSGLNNIKDISFRDDFSAICGITQKELEENFKVGIEKYAEKRGIAHEEALSTMKEWYDGYHFTSNCPDIYNPFSILNLMDQKRLSNYWIASGGVPTILWQGLKGCDEDLESILTSQVSEDQLLGIDVVNRNPLPLLYQTGSLTIKRYRESSGIYKLGIPNNEVKRGLFNFLLPYYANLNKSNSSILVVDMVDELKVGDAEGFMTRLQSLFAGYSYEMRLGNENNFHNVIYMLSLLLGLYVETERKTSDGRIDLLITTDCYRYVIELKIDSTPEEALRQIDEKEYAITFATDSRRVIKIGANFSTESRRLTGWRIVR